MGWAAHLGVFAASPGATPMEVGGWGLCGVVGAVGRHRPPHRTPCPAPQSLGRNEHHQTPVGAGGMDVPVRPGVWDAVLAPRREGGDHPLPAKMEGVQDRQCHCTHTPGSLWPCMATSKWAVLFSKCLQPHFWGSEAGHRPLLATMPCPNPPCTPSSQLPGDDLLRQ